MGTARAAPEQSNWRPSASAIAALEGQLKLPKGAWPLSGYDRYYTGTWVSGRRMIKGVLYIEHANQHGKVRIVTEQELPVIMDGGCSVVTVFFDVATNRVAGTFCNGIA